MCSEKHVADNETMIKDVTNIMFMKTTEHENDMFMYTS